LFRLRTIPAFLLAISALAQMTPKERAAHLDSFELVWTTVRDHNPDPNLNGLDWQAIHDSFKPRIQRAKSPAEVRALLREMIAKLGMSHYTIIPGDLYADIAEAPAAAAPADATTGIETVILDGKAVVKSVAPDSPAARAGIQPGMVIDGIDGIKPDSDGALADPEARRLAARALTRKLLGPANTPVKLDMVDASGQPKHVEINRADLKGTMVQFGNLPSTRLVFEARTLAGGAGYIRFNEFLDPVSLMPRFEAAVHDFARAPGVILDLRDNPGGIGIMAMGMAGYFIGDAGHQLGEMRMRDATAPVKAGGTAGITTLKFTVFPRAEIYSGRLALLLDEGSASTSEILAQGLRDLKRVRIFGTRSAGAALPSDIIRLPDGDGFQYPTASYTSSSGRVLEGNGVIPDVEVRQDREAIATGRDPVIEAAVEWIVGQ
jgi:carboxyl-terminal processing protease